MTLSEQGGAPFNPDPLRRKHIVYILSQVGRSLFQRPTQGSRQYYTGVTTNLKRRICQHNEGKTTATRGIEWDIVAWIGGFTSQEAYALEKYLKRGDTIKRRAVFYAYAERYHDGEHVAEEYFTAIYPAIYRFLKKGYETT